MLTWDRDQTLICCITVKWQPLQPNIVCVMQVMLKKRGFEALFSLEYLLYEMCFKDFQFIPVSALVMKLSSIIFRTKIEHHITKHKHIDVNKRLRYKFSSLSTHPTASSAIVVLYRGTTNALCAPQNWLSSVLN